MGSESGGIFGMIGEPLRAIGLEPSSIPLIGGLFGQSPADQAAVDQMRAASAAYQAMRGPASEASAGAMQNMLHGIGGPANAAMGQVYGPTAMMDFNRAAQNPVTPSMLGVGPTPPPKEGGSEGASGFGSVFTGLLGG